MTRTIARRVDGYLFGAETPTRLHLVRGGLAVLIGLRVALGPYPDLAGQPAALFDPPWFLRLLPSMPPVAVIVAVQVIGATAAASVVARRHTRVAFAIAWTAFLMLAALHTSRGKFQHNDLLLLLAALPFLAAPLALAPAGDRPSHRAGWPIRTATVVVAGTYFFTGYWKLVTSGPAWVTSDNLRHVLWRGAQKPATVAPELARWIADHDLASHLMAGATIAVEMGAVAILFSRVARHLFVLGSLGLHAGIWLTMGLDYWAWVATVAVVLPDWDRVVFRVRALPRRGLRRWGMLPQYVSQLSRTSPSMRFTETPVSSKYRMAASTSSSAPLNSRITHPECSSTLARRMFGITSNRLAAS